MPAPLRYKLIACEVLFRELAFCAARSPNVVDIEFLPKGLHDIGERKMVARLQEAIDQVDGERYQAILLGYALCNNGVRGLCARLPLVLPRAHDCITLLLGSRCAYQQYFDANPGTFFRSPGWIERDTNPNDNQDSITSQLGMNRTYQEYVAKFGEDNARYLMDMLGDWFKNYRKLAYIHSPIGDFPACRQQAHDEASQRGWEYEELPGNLALLQRLLDGQWDDDFLVVAPGQSIAASYDENIVRLE